MAVRKTPSLPKREQRSIADFPMHDREWLRRMEERIARAKEQEAHAKEMRETAHRMHDDAVEMNTRSRLFLP